MGQPTVYLTRESRTPLISVYAIYADSTLFEVTFEPAPFAMTLVKYRRGYDGHDSKEKTWTIINRCSQEVAPLPTPGANLPRPSSSPTPNPPDP